MSTNSKSTSISTDLQAPNLYVHFPFCRRKCAYCALYSKVGVSEAVRREYVAELVRSLGGGSIYKTIYFGGGSPALCDLRPLFEALSYRCSDTTEFTVELHPLDVSDELLRRLKSGGVNRISMGVQSLEDSVLAEMGRGYTASEAERAFAKIRHYFDNAGIDLIVGYPGNSGVENFAQLRNWGLRHCSVYSLILEPDSILGKRCSLSPSTMPIPGDDEVMDQLRRAAAILSDLGLARYEISNYSVPGFECRHNLAVWHGEDYLGLGIGAHGRVGRYRTQNWWGQTPKLWGQTPKLWGQTPKSWGQSPTKIEAVSAESDENERKIFSLRTRDGISTEGHPEWIPILERFVEQGLLTETTKNNRYRLTTRGTEVCDTVLAELL